jgi:predicted transcriptional regulator
LAPRRSPAVIALEVLDCVGSGETSKWDLIKVLGNEAQFRVWVEEFLLPEGVLVERRDGQRYFYRRTERGELLHGLLRSGNMLRILHRVSGRKLR